MAKGPLITPEVQELISSYHKNYPKWKPREVRTVIRNILLGESKKRPELLPKLNRGWPSLSSVRMEIKKTKPSIANPSSKDKPWNLGTLVDYPIPPDAMPTVMLIYKKALAQNDELTIREVQWIARLYKIIDDLDLVWDWAWQYALSEWVAEITHDETFISTQLDLKLIGNPQYATIGRRELERWGAIMDIAERYGADLDESLHFVVQFVESDLTLEEIEEIAKSGKYKKGAQDERKHKAKK